MKADVKQFLSQIIVQSHNAQIYCLQFQFCLQVVLLIEDLSSFDKETDDFAIFCKRNTITYFANYFTFVCYLNCPISHCVL